MALRNYSNNAVPAVIATGGVTSSQTSIPIVGSTGAGYPAPPFILGLDRGTSAQEVTLCTSIIDGTHFGVTRGYNGSTAVSHLAGATVEHTAAALDYSEPNTYINTYTVLGDIIIGNGTTGGYGALHLPTGASQYPGWPNGLALVADNTQSLGVGWETVLPVSAIIWVANATIPGGYAAANGQSLSTTTYAGLFAAIGYAYGGSGSSFNVPDVRGRVVVGAGTGAGLTLRTLATSGGEENHVLVVNEMPNHSHTGGGTTGGESTTHTHGSPGGIQFAVGLTGSGPYGVPNQGPNWITFSSNTIANSNDHTHGYSFTTSAVGGGAGHNNMQPWIALTALIKC